MNVAQIANNAITAVNKNTDVRYFKNNGIKTDDDGNAVLSYSAPIDITCQIQQQKSIANVHVQNGATINTNVRKLWLFNFPDVENQPRGMWRPTASSGDYVQFPDGTFWLITAVDENYIQEGWQSVTCTLTIEPPEAIKNA